jgi:hypothetical protein
LDAFVGGEGGSREGKVVPEGAVGWTDAQIGSRKNGLADLVAVNFVVDFGKTQLLLLGTGVMLIPVQCDVFKIWRCPSFPFLSLSMMQVIAL